METSFHIKIIKEKNMEKENPKIDIIDFIVSEERKKAEAFQAQNNENLTLLDEVNIFKENDPTTGIWKKENLRPIFKASQQVLMGYM
ncbi:hypothetical protein EZ449_20720 [Pedobacter frigidisoli]|uniref:Uncharacterized protein n=1 Tax=Pedobacter frigidisoli TaxID=2530455 RepID=A0A4R0NIU4_9SPHI|nr:hypothetical protein [Pedobacter frigidisoli]TCD00582.1 hypothetical protein EZ449_20720 [Pedobacter frigidisoli]